MTDVEGFNRLSLTMNMDIDEEGPLDGPPRARRRGRDEYNDEDDRQRDRQRRKLITGHAQDLLVSHDEMIRCLQRAQPPVEGFLGGVIQNPDGVDWTQVSQRVNLPRLLKGRYVLERCRWPHEVTQAFHTYFFQDDQKLSSAELAYIGDPLLDVLFWAFVFAEDDDVEFKECDRVRALVRATGMNAMDYLEARGFWPIPVFLEGKYVLAVSALMQHILGVTALEACTSIPGLLDTARQYFTRRWDEQAWHSHPLVYAVLHAEGDPAAVLPQLVQWATESEYDGDDDGRDRYLYEYAYGRNQEEAYRQVIRYTIFLLDRGADIHAQNERALALAVQYNGRPDDADDHDDDDEDEPVINKAEEKLVSASKRVELEEAKQARASERLLRSRSGAVRLVELLLARGATPTPETLLLAVRDGTPEVALTILRTGVDVNADNGAAIEAACEIDSLIPLEFMLHQGRVDLTNQILLEHVVVRSRTKALELLLNRGADIGEACVTALHGYIPSDRLQYLLDRRPPLDLPIAQMLIATMEHLTQDPFERILRRSPSAVHDMDVIDAVMRPPRHNRAYSTYWLQRLAHYGMDIGRARQRALLVQNNVALQWLATK